MKTKIWVKPWTRRRPSGVAWDYGYASLGYPQKVGIASSVKKARELAVEATEAYKARCGAPRVTRYEDPLAAKSKAGARDVFWRAIKRRAEA